jgi:Family of unknown function (DUF5304)
VTDGERIGTAAEEAARLIGAFGEWVGQAAESVDGHLGTGSAECRLCPICQGLALVRGRDPEVIEHLNAAATSLLAALRAALASEPGERPVVQRIDIG